MPKHQQPVIEHGHSSYGQYQGIYSNVHDVRPKMRAYRSVSEEDCPRRSQCVQEICARRWLLAEHPGRLERFNAAYGTRTLEEAVKALGAMEDGEFKEWKESIG